MKYIAICAQGLEDITQLEIKELLKAKSEIIVPGRVLFSAKSVVTFLKKTQSVIKLYELHQETVDMKQVQAFPIVSPFCVRCSSSNPAYSTKDVEKNIGEVFFKDGNTVHLNQPKTTVFVDIVEDKIFVGIDLTPLLLSKRAYRLKIHNQSLNACIAYALVRLAGYNGKKILLDPFAKDGVITIEAARFKKGKIFAYDSLFSHVKNVEINAKMAGVRKDITISRIETEWLDTKFEDEEVDFVVSAVPFVSHALSENFVKKMYVELFEALEYIVKKGGRIVLITQNPLLLREEASAFTLLEERVVATSSLFYHVFVLRKV